MAAGAKKNDDGALNATQLIEHTKQLNHAFEASLLAGFEPGKAQTRQQALFALYNAFRRGDPASAALYLDLRYLPEDMAKIDPISLARGLLFIFAQQNVLDLALVSSDIQGDLEDGLPNDLKQAGAVTLSEEVIPIYLQRLKEAEGSYAWRIANATVIRIPDMWDELGYSDLAVWLSRALPDFYILSMGNGQFTTMLFTLIAGWFATDWISQLVRRLLRSICNPWEHALRRFLQTPLRLILYVLLIRTVMAQLGLSVMARAYLESSPLEYIVAIIFAFGLLNLYRDYKIRQLELLGEIEYVALIKPVIVIVRIIVATTSTLMWADHAGFNVSTLITGLGVGSIAVALAAQKTLENVISAITLYTARPIRPGDWCRFA